MCVEGKQHRTKFNTSTSTCNETLGLVHSDVCGKVDPSSLGGAQYFLTFIDDCSRYTWVYALKSKDEVFEKFKEWKCLTEKALGQKVKILRTDNGGEYTSKEFEKFLKRPIRNPSQLFAHFPNGTGIVGFSLVQMPGCRGIPGAGKAILGHGAFL